MYNGLRLCVLNDSNCLYWLFIFFLYVFLPCLRKDLSHLTIRTWIIKCWQKLIRSKNQKHAFSIGKSCFLSSSKPTMRYMVSLSHHILLCSQISLCSQLSSSLWEHWDCIQKPTQIIQDNLPISRVLILSSRCLNRRRLIFPGPGIRT